MEPISWSIIAGLLVKFGLPIANDIITKALSGKTPTVAEWNALYLSCCQDAKDRALEQLKANGIDPESEQGKTILALVS